MHVFQVNYENSVQQVSQNPFRHLFCLLWLSVALVVAQARADELTQKIDGDIGLGGYYTRSLIRGNRDDLTILPYLDFNFARMFARVDTLGLKTMKLGNGNLELAGRISQDGFNTNAPELRGLEKRAIPIPLGIGSLQETPYGGILINAFHDFRQSHGNLFELLYGGEIDLPRVTFYPLAGVEYQSSDYVRYFYGISAQEAANSQYSAYQPAGAFNKFIGLITDIKLTDEYHLNFNIRRKWLGNTIVQSPIVSEPYLDTSYLSFSYRFK